ncbi:uncharacterized protein L201_001032 [Kwoniella dendrophila CBS 6074]|uniref:Histidinol-phosphatase n=1 Tax=Kwoniella dendrophila CBS 6074 TaxID=1295534 RepID=A0AAX4JL91_9TREE
MPHSHHSHSGQFCRHAKDQLDDVVKEAIRQGFEVFGLSEHAPRWRVEDLFPEEADLKPSDLLSIYLDFLKTAIELKIKYQDQIKLLISIETDYITNIDLTNILDLINEHEEINYIVGSVHHVNGISIDFDKSTWLRSIQSCSKNEFSRTMNPGPPPFLELPSTDDDNPEKESIKYQNDYKPTEKELIVFLKNYLDQQFNLINFYKPEIIGHFDLCLLWIPDFKLKFIPIIWNRIIRNVKTVIEYGGLFEANSAAIRKGWKGSYPSEDILELIISLGGKICLSDDSHGISYVGLNYLKMKDYLVDQGVKEIWYLVSSSERKEDGDIEFKNDRQRVRARKLDKWDTHPFWERKSKDI